MPRLVSIRSRLIVPPPSEASLLLTVRTIFVARLYALAIVIGAGVLIVLSVLVNSAVAALGRYAESWLPMPEWVLQSVNFVAAFGLMAVTFALLYKVLPDAYVSWGDGVRRRRADGLALSGGHNAPVDVSRPGGRLGVRLSGEHSGSVGMGVLLDPGFLLWR